MNRRPALVAALAGATALGVGAALGSWVLALGGAAVLAVSVTVAVQAPRRAARRSAAPHLEPGESLLRFGPARLVQSLETFPGTLYLTPIRLLYVPTEGQPRAPKRSIPLADVTAVAPFMGVGVLPNGVCLTTATAEHRVLVPADRHKAWTAAIERARTAR